MARKIAERQTCAVDFMALIQSFTRLNNGLRPMIELRRVFERSGSKLSRRASTFCLTLLSRLARYPLASTPSNRTAAVLFDYEHSVPCDHSSKCAGTTRFSLSTHPWHPRMLRSATLQVWIVPERGLAVCYR